MVSEELRLPTDGRMAKLTIVASSTLLSISTHLTSEGETSSPMVISRHSRLANLGFRCLLAEGGLFRSSWTAAWVKEW